MAGDHYRYGLCFFALVGQGFGDECGGAEKCAVRQAGDESRDDQHGGIDGKHGSQIAYQIALNGFNVTVYNHHIDTAEKRINALKADYQRDLNLTDQEFQAGLDNITTITTDLKEAVKDADYVITTIRVGGDHMRVRDERIALSHGVLGQETTGAAGVSFAMRSVPALASYCELIKKYAKPDVKVFNFTNPAGVVSQALRDMGYDFTYGICDAPSGMLHQFAEYKGVDPASVQGECYGLNHLSFFRNVTVDGEDIMSDLIHDDGAYAHTDLRFFEKDLVLNRGCVPNEYLYYFYYRERAVANVLSSPQTRGELIEEINREMTSELASIDIENDFEKGLACFEKWYGMRENNYMAAETGIHRDKPWTFDVYGKDAGGYAGVALRFMDIARSGKTQQMILCTPNNGAIPGLLDTDVIESTCDISTDGCVPHRVEADSVPAGNLELIRRVKYYERTVARGIVNRSKRDIVESLAMHPLVNSYSLAKDIAAQYFELNRDYIDGWTD